jgi:hypothetical protein
LKKNLLFRSWFYFRTGFAQYFSFIIAAGNMFTITYYLLIENIASLDIIFPSFSSYVIISSIVGIPSLAILGFVHMKKSHAYKSESDIIHESLSYNYKLMPGIHRECLAPLYLELLRLGRKSLLDEKITDEEIEKLHNLESKLDLLAKGGSLPIPKKFDE